MRKESKEDQSVNFINNEQFLEGFLESRFVRRSEDYFICYLSSQTGCNKGCKFCWLTSTKQTKFENTTPIEFLTQANSVLKHYKTQPKAKTIHYNFMARGEILSNPFILDMADKILYDLGTLANSTDEHLSVRYNVSSIVPKNLESVELEDIFRIMHPTIYYSLYSTDDDWKKQWLPQALPTTTALEKLKRYINFSKKRVKIHHCFIAGENDSTTEVYNMCDLLNSYLGNMWDFNLVRYNPYSSREGCESSESVILRNTDIIKGHCKGKVKIIPRVGFDVNASCGMFEEKQK